MPGNGVTGTTFWRALVFASVLLKMPLGSNELHVARYKPACAAFWHSRSAACSLKHFSTARSSSMTTLVCFACTSVDTSVKRFVAPKRWYHNFRPYSTSWTDFCLGHACPGVARPLTRKYCLQPSGIRSICSKCCKALLVWLFIDALCTISNLNLDEQRLHVISRYAG